MKTARRRTSGGLTKRRMKLSVKQMCAPNACGAAVIIVVIGVGGVVHLCGHVDGDCREKGESVKGDFSKKPPLDEGSAHLMQRSNLRCAC